MNLNDKLTTKKIFAVSDWKISIFISNFIFRARDILAAAIGLLILSPLFLFVAIRIKRDSPGPVFFKGERVGKNGKIFHILKFRTMHENPESYKGPKITGENDPRITKIGCWLRKSKLNELPQLWNVLLGEMSLVGPRPEDPKIAQSWPDSAKEKILSVQPGITSPASVLFRDEESMLSSSTLMETYFNQIQPDKLRLDLLYIHYRSIWVDFDTLLLTFLVLLPRLSNPNIREKAFYGGAISKIADNVRSWFVIDFFVAVFGLSLAAVIWRSTGPINIGFLIGVIEAFEFAIEFSIVGAIFGVQKIQWSKASPSDIIELFGSTFFATILALIINRYHTNLPGLLLIIGGILTFIGMVAVRYRYRIFTGVASRWLWFRKSRDLYRERVLIIGSGDAGSYAAWMLSNTKERSKFRLMGYLDDDYDKQGFRFRGSEVLGSTDDLEQVIQEHDIGIVLFAIHNIDEEKKQSILNRCRESNAQVVMFPDIISSLSQASSHKGYSNGNNHETQVEQTSSISNRKQEFASLSGSQKEKMLGVLEELKTHLKNSDYENSLENISDLQNLIHLPEEENRHEY